MTDKNLQDIAVGDKVCLTIESGWQRRLVGLRTSLVERVTATQITALGERWTKRGRRVGGGDWDRDHLRVWTQELQAEADRGAKIMAAERVCHGASEILKSMKDDDALRIAAMLPAELKVTK